MNQWDAYVGSPFYFSEMRNYRAEFEEIRQKIKSAINKDIVSDNNSKRIQEIKSTITSAYTQEKTAIEFVDWKECPFDITYDNDVIGDRQSYDAVFVYMELNQDIVNEYVAGHPEISTDEIQQAFSAMLATQLISGKSDIGDLSKTRPEKISVMIIEEMVNSRLTTLHEFGHLSGLIHEHERKDAFKLDPYKENLACVDVDSSGRYPVITEEGRWQDEDLIKEEYDPHSIMNYCQNNRDIEAGKKNAVDLSSVDEKELLNFYKDMPLSR